MNTQRLVVLGLALVAACGAAFVVRGMLGGGTPKVEARPTPEIAMSQVLVASVNLQPGEKIAPDQVRWENWPTASVDSSFITHASVASEDDAVKGTVVRQPLIAGQPITVTALVHADQAGFMAAMLDPGMRAVSITISADSGAGGFILPNDRVDLILTQKSNDNPPRVHASTILSDIRVLAVDQTFKQDKDTKTVIGKTATLELSAADAERVARAQAQGTLSLSLRPLADDSDTRAAAAAPAPVPAAADDADDDDAVAGAASVNVIRYGVAKNDATQPSGKAQ